MVNVSGLYQCPVCNSTIVFKLNTSNYNVCKNCSSILHRQDNVLVKNNTIDLIYEQISAIKIGTKGIWNDTTFEVIGMVRFWMEETVYNYWTVVFSNGKFGMLAEGYGLYAIYIPIDIDNEQHGIYLNTIDKEKYSEKIKKDYTILTKKYTVKRCEAEGEFMLLNGGNNLRLFEFSLTDGTSFEFQQSNELRDAYSIVYAEFTDFSFTNLASPKFSKKTIECHHCKTINHIKTWPYAQSYGCTGCNSRYALDKNGNLIPIEDNKTKGQFDLELNQTGTLFGIDYQIIGMALKQERTIYKSKWKEYTLFNNQYGYAFLSEYNGHWIFVQEKGACPTLLETVSNSFEYGGELFDLYNDYHFDVLDARGEFPYNIFDDEDIRVKEYISPPQMWIFEKSRDEGYNWYHAKHIGKHEMQTFQKPLPYKLGVGAIEPKGSIDLKTLKITAALVIAFALLIHLFTANLNKQEILLDRGFSTTDSATSINFVSEKFTLNKWKSNLSFELSAPVQNSWLSLDINLVNAKTGDEYALDQGVEYYSGYEGGESWSEGSQTTTEYLSSIPSGTYYLNIHSSADTYNRVNDFHLTVTNDVEMTRNLVIIIILLSITPLGYYFYRRYAETSRWANSDFSPYTTTT